MSIVRSTNTYLFDLIRSRLGQQGLEINKLEEQAITGRRINRPSDAPAEMVQVNRLREELANQDVYDTNAQWATSLLGLVDQTLEEVTNLSKRASEIAVQMTSEHYNAVDRAAAATEVEALAGQMLILANSELGGRYLFSGDAYDGAAFDSTGTYQGSAELPEILVGEDRWVQSGWNGADVFQGDVDSFQILEDLETALNANDPDAVFDLLDDLSDVTEQAISWRQEAGWAYNNADDALALSESLKSELSGHLSSAVDANIADVYLQLEQARNSYSAALQVASGGMGASLFDVL